MVGWTPITYDIEERLGSLGDRAKKRTGIQVTPTKFVVFGDPKLGDSYEKYEVELTGKKYQCACQSHTGGQYRKICSHISYVVLARRGIVDWLEEYVPDNEHQGFFQILPDELPTPPFVSTESVPQYRELLDQQFGSPPLPDWVENIYPEQWDAYCEILFQFDGGKKVVFLNAPTGSGKTLIGEMVRRSMGMGMYICTTKTLQDQVEEDFPYASVIKGRSNYRTLNHPNTKWIACDLCTQHQPIDPCKYCADVERCPYRVARNEAVINSMSVANTSYYLYETNGLNTRFGGRRPLVIVDEADALEDELMRYIEIGFSPALMKDLGIKPPEKKTVTASWQSWIDEIAMPALNRKAMNLQFKTDAKDVRMLKRIARLQDQVRNIKFDEDWVYTDYDRGWVKFKPIKVDKVAPRAFWNKSKAFLLMSATIISAQQMAEDLGLDDDDWTIVDMPSTFPVENRPIYIEPVANITAKTKDTAWPLALKRIKEIAEWHDERILVHTVSYAYAEYLAKGIGSRAYTYRNAGEREQVLADFLESDNGILVAPSFERGVDLAYDKCRVIIVAKVPFPNLGDKQVSKRLYAKGGNGWYAMQTVRALVQMTGRAMRRADDTCEVYVIDQQFMDNVWKKSRHLIPGWWQEAVVMEGSPNLREMRKR